MGGEGRCLAAEDRPNSELAACLSSSRVRGGGVGEEGEQGAGRRRRGGEAAAESRGRTPCRGGTTPAKQSQEIPAPPNWSNEWGAGGASDSMSGGVPPLKAPAKNRTLTPKVQHLQSSPHSTQQARGYFLISIFQAGPAQGPGMLTDTSPISWLLSLPQRLGSQRGTGLA